MANSATDSLKCARGYDDEKNEKSTFIIYRIYASSTETSTRL